MLGIASSNRDESVYEEANEFRLDRETGPEHLAFGSGAHLCLGNHLSRMVGAVVLTQVLDRFAPGQIELVPDYRWVCVGAVHEYGPETLDVVIDGPAPRPAGAS
jgi:cytochrome P450